MVGTNSFLWQQFEIWKKLDSKETTLQNINKVIFLDLKGKKL